MKYGTFNLKDEELLDRCICPICGYLVTPITSAFNNCYWKFEGTQVIEGKKKEFVSQWTKAGDEYNYFDEKESGIVEWRHLTFKVVRIKWKNYLERIDSRSDLIID
ncbi:hypothetical protein M0812_20529 [Anaeramoeba flamelloides]|uniref:Uncharacterized protein n=1 Tax=Anaeramoeba flamelloides TaxID=1746091 RepID=A0AAV7YRP9_9EUKA|nr:hypothetical protein M0812_20529 [Anaeramoeba flamelloides]